MGGVTMDDAKRVRQIIENVRALHAIVMDDEHPANADLVRMLGQGRERFLDRAKHLFSVADAARPNWPRICFALWEMSGAFNEETREFAYKWERKVRRLRNLGQPETTLEEMRAQLGEWDRRISGSSYKTKSQAIVNLGIPRTRYYEYQKRLRK
jgi:hypothetical protein